MKRLFFALWPDDELHKQLLKLSRRIERERLKPTRPNNLHMTLVFLGNIDKKQEIAIKQGASEINAQSMQIIFDRLTLWRRPGILCLTASEQPEQLLDLVSQLEKLAITSGIEIDTRPYKAHITLARQVRRKPDLILEPLLWRSDHFALVESVSTEFGTQYEVLENWPLQIGS